MKERKKKLANHEDFGVEVAGAGNYSLSVLETMEKVYKWRRDDFKPLKDILHWISTCRFVRVEPIEQFDEYTTC